METNQGAKPLTECKSEPISEELLLFLCRNHFGANITVRDIDRITLGTFNETYALVIEGLGKLILRIAPPRSTRTFRHEAELMRREYSVQPYLSPLKSLLPSLVAADFTRLVIDRDYVFYSYLEGDVWGLVQSRLTEEQNLEIWRQIGTYTKQLGQVTGDGFGYPDPMGRHPRWSDFLLKDLQGKILDMKELGFGTEEAEELGLYMEQGRELLDEIKRPMLSHGDLWPNNILVRLPVKETEPPEVIGIVDTERAYWGDPLFDWSFSYYSVPDAFWEGYGFRELTPGLPFRRLVYKGLCHAMLLIDSIRGWSDPEEARQGLAEINRKCRQLLTPSASK